jgi:trehalose 6-phosphate phosphatase
MREGKMATASYDHFFAGWASVVPVPDCADTTLLLDFDGTLVELADAPDAVEVSRKLVALIETLSESLGPRLALVSGRDVATLETWFGGTGAMLVGNHGAELAGAELPRPAALERVLPRLRGFAARHPGVLVEEKRFGAALHYRRAPAAEADCRALAEALATEHGLQLQHGKSVAELRFAERDKGWALRTLMARPETSGTRPVFIGDDLTDEAAFAAAEELGGYGILVGQPRQSAARYRLKDVAEVRSWLERLCSRT